LGKELMHTSMHVAVIFGSLSFENLHAMPAPLSPSDGK